MLSMKSETLLANMRGHGGERHSRISDARRDSESTAVGLVPISFPRRSRLRFPCPYPQKRGRRLEERPISPRQAKMLQGAACYSDIRPRIRAHRNGRAILKP